MDAAFTLFPLLPPEIRLEIWHIVFTTAWSFTGFGHRQDAEGRYTGTVVMRGRVCRTAGASCREARAAMLRVFEPSPFGPIRFARHLFFLQGLDMMLLLPLQTYVRIRKYQVLAEGQRAEIDDVLARARHVMLPLVGLDLEMASERLSVIRDKCASLRSLVVVCDRHVMAEHERGSRNAAGEEEEEEDRWRPDGPRDGWLDWSSSRELFEASPREVDIAQLARDLEGEEGEEGEEGDTREGNGHEHTASRALALAKAWPDRRRRLFIGMPTRRRMSDAEVAEALAEVKRVVSSMPSRPRLYLRMRHEVPRFKEPKDPSRP